MPESAGNRLSGKVTGADVPWGSDSDVGRLTKVLMSPPTRAGLMADPLSGGVPSDLSSDQSDEGWYWLPGECPPRNELPVDEMREQWDRLVSVLEDEGVEVFTGTEPAYGRFACFTRDAAFLGPDGAILGQLPGLTRKGEEQWASRSMADIGVPVVAAIDSDGQLEGGSAVWINPTALAIGLSNCVNEAAAARIEQILQPHGVEVIRVPLAFYDIHLDGFFGMLDTDLALADLNRLPFTFISRIRELGVEVIAVAEEDDPWVTNFLTVRPRRVIMPEGLSDATRSLLEQRGVEVISIPFDQVHLEGGGIRCSTSPLARERVRSEKARSSMQNPTKEEVR